MQDKKRQTVRKKIKGKKKENMKALFDLEFGEKRGRKWGKKRKKRT